MPASIWKTFKENDEMIRITTCLIGAALSVSLFAQESLPPYKNPSLPVETRVADLLSRMTPEEKAGQLQCCLGWEMYRIDGDDVSPSDAFRRLVEEQQPGMLWATYRADPWTRKTLQNGLNPVLAAKAGNALQKYVMEHTRLGIPLLLAEEAPHGHMAIGTTVFPTGIGMAATWSPELLEEVGEAIGEEVRAQGGHISYGPVLDLARDPRWSRVEETFGEDPVLGGTLGAAMVTGLGGGDLSKPFSTIATLKHFLAYAVPEGGQNGNYASVGARELHEYFLPPFRQAIDAGALSVMTSYNSIDGTPCTSNRALLTDLLRGEWGFRGFTVSDLYSIDGLHESHFVASDLEEAGIQALEAGVDVDLGAKAYATLCQSLRSGRLDESVLDTAVARVLRMKFELGLFEHPYVDPQEAGKRVRTAAHVDLARRVARASVTLLKDDRHLLPLNRQVRRVAVIGPNADNGYNQLGDYTAPQADDNVKTVLEGIRSKLSPGQVEYVRGCAIRDTSACEIERAVQAARRADVVIAVVGGSSARDFKTNYQETGAAITDGNSVSDMECGEGFDRATLGLLGRQQELLEAVKATGKPLVVVYVEGRPLDKTWAAEQADALLTAYYPGQEGGLAVADVLFGDYNPAGRLPMTVPRSVGQIPIYYNKKAPRNHDYVELPATPLYAFGYGLSYTKFAYSDLTVTKKGETTFEVSFTLKNEGGRDGEEVAQLYLRDCQASVVPSLLQLKKFARVFLRQGESRKLSFTLTGEDFSLVNARLERVVEPGAFEVMVGAASDDIRLRSELLVSASAEAGR